MAIQSLLNFSPTAPNVAAAPNALTSVQAGFVNPSAGMVQDRAQGTSKVPAGPYYTPPYTGNVTVPSSLSSPVKSTGTLPAATRNMTTAERNAWMQNQERADLGYIASTNANRGQLAQGWQGGVLTPFAQAVEALGTGPQTDAIVNQLKGIAAPTWEDPSKGWAQTALGGSLASALTPDVMNVAATNPYSTMAQIAKALWHQNNVSGDAYAAAGATSGTLGDNGANALGMQNDYQAGLQRYNAAQSFLQNFNQNYQNFLNQVGSATTAQGQAAQTAANNVINMMQLGLLKIPTVQNYQPPSGTVTRAGVPGGYYVSGKGTYGGKPLY